LGTKTTRKTRKPDITTCLACSHVLSLQRPVLYVAHDNDGVWKFTCRPIGHKITQIKVMPVENITQLDASLKELFEMPPGVASVRSNANSNWEPFLLYPDKEKE